MLEKLNEAQEEEKEQDEIIEKNSKNSDEESKSSSSEGSDNSLDKLMITVDLNIKSATFFSCIMCIASISTSIVFSILLGKNLLFDYNFNKSKDILTMNREMMYIFIIALDCFNIAQLYFLIKNKEQMLIKIIYINLRWFFVLTQICFGCLFLIGDIWNSSNWTLILSASVNMATTILLAFYFQDIKKKKNMNIGTFICVYIYLSVLFAFISYVTFYNFSCILLSNSLKDNRYCVVIQICTNLLQTILGILLLTYFKDIVFAVSSFYIQLAIVVNNIQNNNNQGANKNLKKAIISIDVFLGILGLSSIIILIKYGKKAFGFEEVEDIKTEQDNIIEK